MLCTMPKAPRLEFDDTQTCLEAALVSVVEMLIVSTTRLALRGSSPTLIRLATLVGRLVCSCFGDTMSDGVRLDPRGAGL